MWVNYKSHTAWRWFLLCTSDGQIVYVSTAQHGNVNDEDEYKYSGVIQDLQNFYAPLHDQLEPHEKLALGGDKGKLVIHTHASSKLRCASNLFCGL
jgi:DDE superfamily endonuclease